MAARLGLLLLAAALCGWAAAPAGAQLGEIYETYREQGIVNGCDHPPEELRDALASIPADIQAYDPGFGEALNAALSQRSAGCETETLDHVPRGVDEAVDGSAAPQSPLIAAGAPPAGEDDGSGVVALVLALALGAGLITVIALTGPRHPRRGRSRLGGAAVWLNDLLFVLRQRLRG